MACDRCEENRRNGYAFCPACGNPLKEGCIYCAQYEMEGYRFCGKCGRPLPARDSTQPRSQSRSDPLKMAAIVVMPFIMIVLLLEIGIMLYGSAGTWDWLSDKSHPVYMLLPTLVTVGYLAGTGLQVSWMLLMVAIVASFAVMLYQSRSMLRPDPDGNTSDAERTPLYWVCLLFGPTIILNFVVILIQAMTGSVLEVPDDILNMGLEEVLYTMANAAVWEEVISRVLPIGVPMMILAICYGKKDFARNLLGGFGTSRVAWALIIVSSIVFGFAHMSGWGLEKVVPASIGGFAMGYLYVRFGVHASIMFHFLTDYMTAITMHFNPVIASSLLLIIMVISLVCLVAVFQRIGIGLKGVKDLPITGFETGRKGD